MSDIVQNLKDLRDRLDSIIVSEENKATVVTPAPVVAAPAVPVQDVSNSLRRITDPSGYVSNAYPTRDPWNIQHSALILKARGGYIELYEGSGTPYAVMPSRVRHDSDLVWSRSNFTLFYGVTGRELWKFDIGASWDTQPVTIREFSEYDAVSIGVGEGDISIDGDYLPMCGNRTEAFLYRISTDTVGPSYRMQGLNAVYVSPDNNLVLTGEGIRIVRGGTMYEVVPNFGHMDLTRDLDGKEIMVWTNNNDNGIYKVRLDDPKRRTMLLPLGWSPLGGPSSMACHISCPTGKDYSIVSTYGLDDSMVYSNAIIQVPTDEARPSRILAHHKSDIVSGSKDDRYEAQPKATGSGRWYVFNSRENGEYVVYLGSSNYL